MAVPAAVEALLRKHEVEFGVLDGPEPGGSNDFILQTQNVNTTIMRDDQGMVQVVYPAGHLLDVDRVRELSNRELSVVTNGELEKLCRKIQAEQLPAIPLALGLDVIADQALLAMPQLSLNPGSADNIINIEAGHFQKLIAGALVGELSVSRDSLATGNLDNARDIDDITKAVANFTQLRIKQRLEDTLEFPPLPETAQRIIKLRVDPNADIQDLTDIVELDPPLAAQVVSWAASPYYAAPGKIKSVHDAIVRVLGFDLVLNLSLGLALGNTLKMPKDCPRGFTPYWQQAVYTATCVEALVSAIPPKQRPVMGLSYLTGLLHNFGYLILAEVFPPYFSSICRYQEANPYIGPTLIERHLLGVTREQLASWLMHLWNMPEEVCDGLRFQNEPDYQGENSAYANLLFISQRLLRQHGIGAAPLEPIPQALFDRLHLDRDKAQELVKELLESAEELNLIASNLSGN